MENVLVINKSLLLLLFLLVGSFVFCEDDGDQVSSVSPMVKEEQEALYGAIQGFVGNFWNGSDLYSDPCGWTPIQGVYCDLVDGFWHIIVLNIDPFPSSTASSHLEIIPLPSLPQTGKDPQTTLESFEFRSYEGLIGEIPSFIGSLKKLQSLVLLVNGLTGDLPIELGNLVNLRQLVLAGNKFIGHVLPSLAGLTKLLIMDLSRNNLSGPLELSIGSNFTSLLKLDLSNIGLEGKIPEGIRRLKNATLVDLGRNKFSGGLTSSGSNGSRRPKHPQPACADAPRTPRQCANQPAAVSREANPAAIPSAAFHVQIEPLSTVRLHQSAPTMHSSGQHEPIGCYPREVPRDCSPIARAQAAEAPLLIGAIRRRWPRRWPCFVWGLKVEEGEMGENGWGSSVWFRMRRENEIRYRTYPIIPYVKTASFPDGLKRWRFMELESTVSCWGEVRSWSEETQRKKGDSLTEDYISVLPEVAPVSLKQNDLQELREIWESWNSDVKYSFWQKYGDIALLLTQSFKSKLARITGWERSGFADRIQKKGSLIASLGHASRSLSSSIAISKAWRCSPWEFMHLAVAEELRVALHRWSSCLLFWIRCHFWKIDREYSRRFSTAYSPLKDFLTKEWPASHQKDWVSLFRNLQEHDIVWRVPWLAFVDVLYKCGDSDWKTARAMSEAWKSTFRTDFIAAEFKYVPSKLEILKSEFEAEIARKEAECEALRQKNFMLDIDRGFYNTQFELMRKRNDEVEANLTSLQSDYQKMSRARAIVGLGKTSEHGG
ncbi:putative Membrane lipoprotein [Hibiscus syriacus]|uniref:Membrane lipoprotein n=1 Tax=Hibiscus syriacus TaxID=106335 RepID=A0A6A2X3U4_HIBSY|nr:putative Membrane lipoprotein [Hibiscus syriacus]